MLAIAPCQPRLPDSAGIAAVLVTSGNALPALWPAFRDRPILTVGDRTAARATAAGFTQVQSAGGNATDLARLVQQRLAPAAGTLLLASGQGQGAPLAAALRAAGFRVLRRVVYAAAPVPALPDSVLAALRAGSVAAALFFSAETARHFVRLILAAGLADVTRSCDAFAIGRPAAVALEALPWRRIRIAVRPNQDEMLALLP